MCGIAGAFGPVDARARTAVAQMNAAMLHRGPDQDGLWCSDGETGVVLGHRRLSILDLSDAGRQPMIDQASGLVLAFNGECYNYRELRAELEQAGRRFVSDSDTEVVLAAFAHWGDQALARLRGMFALAVWDPRRRSLLLARDRLGIKPLYYSLQDGRVWFASELRALLAAEVLPRRLDRVGLATYLWHGFVPGPRTLVQGVQLLPAGHTLVCTDGQPARPQRYWQYPRTATVTADRDTAARRAGEVLQESVEQHLASDVPLGVFLSGGVDSSVIAALAQRVSARPVTTFNVRFEEARYDESVHARTVAGILKTDHREVLLTGQYFAEHLDAALDCLDQPSFDALNTYFVSRAVREAGLTVALAGTGGDELFGGYSSFVDIPRARPVAAAAGWLPRRWLDGSGHLAARALMGQPSAVWPQTRWGKFGDALATRGDVPALYQVSYGLYTEDFFRQLQFAPGTDLAWGLPSADFLALQERIDGEPLLAAISSLEVASFLGERLLRDTDAASMAVSLEVRVPLLDHIFIETLAQVPEDRRFRPLRRKLLLREMASGQLDPALFDRAKAGFELPLEDWCRRLLAQRLQQTFGDINLAHAIGLNAEAVARLWRAFGQGGPGVYWSRVWSLYVLMTWCRRHGVYLS